MLIAAAAVCVAGGKLTDVDWRRCLTEVMEVTAADTLSPLPLLLSVSVAAD